MIFYKQNVSVLFYLVWTANLPADKIDQIFRLEIVSRLLAVITGSRGYVSFLPVVFCLEQIGPSRFGYVYTLHTNATKKDPDT